MISVDQADFDRWADLPDANNRLPELIRHLILATVPELSRLDMPSGSAVWLPGWDGLLTAETGNAWAPKGDSAWEFSCRGDVGTKANEDYQKRTKDPKGVATATSTFIFVTPRQWSRKVEWQQERRDEGKWANVRAFDASDLVAWLSQAPAAAEWFARLIGKLPADGYTALDAWWENWTTVSQPNISRRLVLAGRQESADRLAHWFQQSATSYYVQAQTREEGIAFVAASALDTNDVWGPVLLSKAIVVKSEAAWNSLIGHTSPLVLIRAFEGNVSSQVAVSRGHHVITPLHANEDPKGNGDTLPRLGRDETVTALTQMGLSENKARALARKTARSLPIVRRQLVDEAGGPTPDWASADPQSPLPALMLIGQWDESNGNDREIVATITGRPYQEIAREVATLAQSEDSPLTKVGARWRFLSHEEAWHLLAPRLTTEEVERFKESAVEILGTESPEFQMPIEERHLANIQGKVVPHSGILRAGIARTLALMGNQGERARNVSNVSYIPELVLRDVLSDNEGWQIWATLDRNLTVLAEAAPEAILSAIELYLSENPSLFESLFDQEGDPLFGGALHPGLLWALEKLGWSPEYFARVVNVLARLALIDPGGRVANRPAGSLAEMFLPWFRLSEACDSDRLETLGALLTRVPESGWKTLVNAYPTGHGAVTDREPPSWRPWGQDGVQQPTCAEIRTFVEGMEQLLLEHVGDDANRWTDIVNIISSLSPDVRRRASEMMTQHIDAIRENTNSNKLWEKLRTELNRHRSFPDANWAMSAADLEPLAAAYQQLTPDDPASAYGWLFDGWPDPPEGTDHDNIEAHFEKMEMARHTAITDAYENGGMAAILSIAESAQQPAQVGQAFTTSIGTEPALALTVDHAGSSNQKLRLLARGILWTISHQSGWVFLDDAITRLKASDASPQALADVFLAAPAEQDTWLRLEQEDPAAQQHYWEQMHPRWASNESEDEVNFVAAKLLAVQRSPAVAEWIARVQVHRETVIQTLEQLPADLVFGTGPELDPNLLAYATVRLFKKLDDDDAVSDATIAALEIPFVRIFRYSQRPNLALYREIARDPVLFADLVTSGYKRSDGVVEAAPNEQAIQISGQILSQMIFGEGEIPGKTEDGVIDFETLSAWVNEARRLCNERARATVGDIFIGHLLAKSPVGEDQIWPCEAVRDLLDGIASQQIGKGFITGTHNLRGVTTRDPLQGGDQERALEDEYSEQAAKIASKWPHTASLLRSIRESYRHEAQWHDDEAEERDQFES